MRLLADSSVRLAEEPGAGITLRVGLDARQAYALASVAVDLRLSEVVNVPYPVVSALLRTDIFGAA